MTPKRSRRSRPQPVKSAFPFANLNQDMQKAVLISFLTNYKPRIAMMGEVRKFVVSNDVGRFVQGWEVHPTLHKTKYSPQITGTRGIFNDYRMIEQRNSVPLSKEELQKKINEELKPFVKGYEQRVDINGDISIYGTGTMKENGTTLLALNEMNRKSKAKRSIARVSKNFIGLI
jgi:hypothetical protein